MKWKNISQGDAVVPYEPKTLSGGDVFSREAYASAITDGLKSMGVSDKSALDFAESTVGSVY